jgi:hypothetical protein
LTGRRSLALSVGLGGRLDLVWFHDGPSFRIKSGLRHDELPSPGAQTERWLGATRDNNSRVRGPVREWLAVSPHRSLYWHGVKTAACNGPGSMSNHCFLCLERSVAPD